MPHIGKGVIPWIFDKKTDNPSRQTGQGDSEANGTTGLPGYV